MTAAMALFSTSGNNAAYYPASPFQILYVKPVGPSSFLVRPGTYFFVPIWNADDSQPIVGEWPTTHSETIPYFFDPSQVGGRDFAIAVDGQTTAIGSGYLAGPVITPTLLDCAPPDIACGNHIVTLGAFLHPLAPGTHTVRIQGGVFGAQVLATYGQSFTEDITYDVTVG